MTAGEPQKERLQTAIRAYEIALADRDKAQRKAARDIVASDQAFLHYARAVRRWPAEDLSDKKMGELGRVFADAHNRQIVSYDELMKRADAAAASENDLGQALDDAMPTLKERKAQK